MVTVMAAASCGGGAGSLTLAGSADAAAPSGADTAASPLMSTRPGMGILAAGGTVAGTTTTCPGALDAAAAGRDAELVTIGYVGPNLDELDALGLETLSLDSPVRLLDAYINEINSNGGLNGRCFELAAHVWSLDDPVGSIERICAELPEQHPLMVLVLGLEDPVFDCVTQGAELPTFGLYSWNSDLQFKKAEGRLVTDRGSDEYLLAVGLDRAHDEGLLGDRIGLLLPGNDSFVSVVAVFGALAEDLGTEMVVHAKVPPEFENLELLGAESRVRLLQSRAPGETERAWSELRPEQADTLRQMEQYYLDTATRLRDEGIGLMFSSSVWQDVRRLMRAAELVGWYPDWLISDTQPASLVLTAVPSAQADNVWQVSSTRSPGDEIPELDHGCVVLRNMGTDAGPFSHRFHTDAWNLLVSLCDYLDIIFGAISRVGRPLNGETFVEALRSTEYETSFGLLMVLGANDSFASDRFRLLTADPNCALNRWGCMRPRTQWMKSDILPWFYFTHDQ